MDKTLDLENMNSSTSPLQPMSSSNGQHLRVATGLAECGSKLRPPSQCSMNNHARLSVDPIFKADPGLRASFASSTRG